jgi:DDE superfamily endonuclease
MGVYRRKAIKDVSSKPISKGRIQWAQTLPWNQVPKRDDFGQVHCQWHDSYMLSCSKVLPQLRALMPVGNIIYSLYRDPAYPMLQYLYGGVGQPAVSSPEAAWNTEMGSARISVEWTFGEVGRQFRHLNLKHSLQIFKFPVAKYYAVAVFFVNCRNSIYGSETSKYFECKHMSLDKYINLVNWN